MTNNETFDFGDGLGPVPAHRHPNGGGWVADSASVADTAHVGPDALVYGSEGQGLAKLHHGSAEVCGSAHVIGAHVSGSAPILFSGPMVRAILDGRKTVTRRVVKLPAEAHPGVEFDRMQEYPDGLLRAAFDDGAEIPFSVRPPCQPGDRLWVRETWAPLGDKLTEVIGQPRVFRADADLVRDDSGDRVGWWLGETFLEGAERPFRWRPSIHMPRWASRITLAVVSVRLEKLQDITEEDAIAEGVSPIGDVGCECGTDVEEPAPHLAACGWSHIDIDPIDTPHLAAFAVLWDSLYAKRGFGWDKNPFVWRIEFRRIAWWTGRNEARRYTPGDELPTIVTRVHDEPWCAWISVDEECRCDMCREELEGRETDGHMSSPRQLMVWGTVITIDGLDIDLEREQVQTWGIFCDACARDLREQADRRAPAALAYRAAQAIPVTDATVSSRARALEAIGELEVEARR